MLHHDLVWVAIGLGLVLVAFAAIFALAVG